MSPHTSNPKPKQRIPLTIYGDDIPLLLRLKHHMEMEANQVLTVTEILKEAIRELAKAKGV